MFNIPLERTNMLSESRPSKEEKVLHYIIKTKETLVSYGRECLFVL